ncbi:MAG: YceI family protein [Actinomycetota bacterium]
MTNSPPTPAFPPGTWSITPETTVTLTVRKLKFITVTATLRLIDGSVTIGPDGTPSAVSASVDAASFASGNPKRDNHVASEDFLDSEAFPLITFEANELEATASQAHVTGTVTVKDASSPLLITVTDIAVDEDSASLRATAVVDRNALGVGAYPSVVISSEVAVAVHAHLVAEEAP